MYNQLTGTELLRLIMTRLDEQDKKLDDMKESVDEIVQFIRKTNATNTEGVHQQMHNPNDIIRKPKVQLNHGWVIRSILPLLDDINFNMDDVQLPKKNRQNNKKQSELKPYKEGIDDEKWINGEKLFSMISTDALRIVERY
jgi:hypothetical protein